MRRRNMGKNAKASTENNISENTARTSCRREASTTAAEMAALIDSTEVSLFFQLRCHLSELKKEGGNRPFTLNWRRSVRVICQRSVHEEECRRKSPDRVSGRRRGERAKDGCESDEHEEDEQGRFDCVSTWSPPNHQQSNYSIKGVAQILGPRTTIGCALFHITPEVFDGLPYNTSDHKYRGREDN